MSDPAEELPPEAVPRTPDVHKSTGGLRLIAAIVALMTFALGIGLSGVLGLGFLGLIGWFVVVVPGTTLLALLIVERFRRV